MAQHSLFAFKEQVLYLIKNELYDSAEILCSLFTSALSNYLAQPDSPILQLHVDALCMFADCMFAKLQHQRALHFYQLAFDAAKTEGGSSTFQLRYKIAKCYETMGNPREALKELELIPPKHRDLPIFMALGRLHQANSKKLAIASFKSALQLYPFALEALQQLAVLGLDSNEILDLLPPQALCGNRKDGMPPTCSIENGWLHALATAICGNRGNPTNSNSSGSAANSLTALHRIFPRNSYLLTLSARASVEAELPIEALQIFRSVRTADPTAVDGMEEFGLLLLEASADNLSQPAPISGVNPYTAELRGLTNAILGESAVHPEGWLMAAMCAHRAGEDVRAQAFVDKALAVPLLKSKIEAAAYNLRGYLHLHAGHAEQALTSYCHASSLRKDLSSYAGMVQCQLGLKKPRDALYTAKEAVANLPRSSATLVLLANALASSGAGAAEATKTYTQALKLNPHNSAATSGLAELLIGSNKFHEAIAVLRAGLDVKGCAKLRTLLGRVLARVGSMESVQQLQLAAAIDEAEGAAELEIVENAMREDGAEDDGEEDEV